MHKASTEGLPIIRDADMVASTETTFEPKSAQATHDFIGTTGMEL